MASKYQKRHYEDVARILKSLRDQERDGPTVIELVCDEFEDLFRWDNPLFDVVRFRKAAGR